MVNATAMHTANGRMTADRLLTRAPVLEVRDVVVRFGGLTAVDVDRLTVHEGRIVGLVGSNGAGKTTLFDVISGFVTPDAGSLVLDGDLDLLDEGMGAGQRARYGIGRSFQNATLFQSMTVAETLAVAFERRLAGQGLLSAAFATPWSRRRERLVREHVEELVERLGLGAFHDKFISELSTGSRRIVDIACVMAHRPRLLLLDEPSSGIAQREVEALETLLRRVKSELGCTLMVVEHDIPLIRSLADELYAMEVGQVISHGTPHEVLSDPAVIRAYLGTDPRAVERSGAATTSDLTENDDDPDLAAASLEALTLKQLREQARALDIPGRSSMNRAELVDAVRTTQEEPEADDGNDGNNG
ncbi:MAG: ATP-binding cassette domain-containing protein [Actinobacteria bacterium]|nr:ATP-binding cassette domain-containing protein [Actinomycetota bacterium]